MWTRVGPRNRVLDGRPGCPRGRGNLGERQGEERQALLNDYMVDRDFVVPPCLRYDIPGYSPADRNGQSPMASIIQAINVVGYKAASPPCVNHSVVFAVWRQGRF